MGADPTRTPPAASTFSPLSGGGSVAHEYFHVLQGTLIDGDRAIRIPVANTCSGLAWSRGLAVYADYIYSQNEELVRVLFLLDVSDCSRWRGPDIDLG